ncbi:MAG TPA: glycosyltransferase family 1 protein [Candidatus Omnitrophota bacterium]|nr:glycosyltransferase family 1 protein [Candidatus Omnitrophota bacterium]
MARSENNAFFDASVFQIPLTGVAKSTQGLYTACRKRMPRSKYIGIHNRPLSFKDDDRAAFRRIGKFLPDGIWRSAFLPFYLNRTRPEFIHFPWNGCVPGNIRGTIVATTLHDVLPLEIPEYFGGDGNARSSYIGQKQADIDRSDVLFTDSEYSGAQIARNFKLRREPVVISFGPTIDQKPRRGKGDYFIYLGGYSKRKGLEELLDIYLELVKQRKLSSKMLLTGSVSSISEKFARYVAEGKAMGMVEERGYVDDDELSNLLSNARALVYPSKYEGFGLPPLEAMNCGCPVITTRFTSISEVCGDAAIYIDPQDRKGFAASMVEIEKNDELFGEMAAKGKARAERFSWDRAAEKFLGAIFEHKKAGNKC